MCPTLTVAQSAVAAKQFPENVEWSYIDMTVGDYATCLTTGPSGAAPFGTAGQDRAASTGQRGRGARRAELDVSPLLPEVPIGAPGATTRHPKHASRACGRAARPLAEVWPGARAVTDRSGTVRSFRPLVRYTEQRLPVGLAEGDADGFADVAARGAEGRCSRPPGTHGRGVVEWESSGMPRRVTGSAVVAISAAVDEEHAEAARRVIGTPDALLTLVLGGDHLTAGLQAIRALHFANDVLKLHFAYVEAKRARQDFSTDPPTSPEPPN